MTPDDVDIHALPVPDFGLTCPKCDYALKGLPEHRCPECGSAFDIEGLIRPYTALRPPEITGRELPVPDLGLSCPDCAAPLAGAPTHECPTCGRPFDMAEFCPRGRWIVAFSSPDSVKMMCAEMVLRQHLVPILYGDDELRRTFGALGSTRLGPRIEVPRAFYFEARLILRREAARIEAVHADGLAEQEVDCPKCGEGNPATFDVCWNCGQPLRIQKGNQTG